MKIVQFKKGTYGIRIGNWFSGYGFLDKDLCICKYYLGINMEFESLQEAKVFLRRYQNSLIDPYKSYKIIK